MSQFNTKPTVSTANVASVRALQQGEGYVIAPVLGRRGSWSVRKQGAQAPYHVDTEAATCSCPHFTQRLTGTGKPCKHMEMVRLKMALLQSRPAPSPVVISREERMRRDFGPEL